IGNSSRSIEENSLPLDSRESPVEETEFVSASSDLRPSDSGVTFALHETVSQSPESNSSFQPKRTAQTQTNSEEDFSLPSIRR
ncbi:MAG: hypothetical protein KDA65_14040, partial [Planctomycetaceae bacterium]|nr:hypothetical protein [Planctomycetaceae bacterium]